MEKKKIIVLDAGVAPKQVADARACCVLGPRPYTCDMIYPIFIQRIPH